MARRVTGDEYRQSLQRAGVKYTRSDGEWHEFEVPGTSMPVHILIHFDPSDDTFSGAEMTMETRDREHQVARYRSMAELNRALGIRS